MKIFKIRIELKTGCQVTIWQRANHLQGAIGQIYQNKPDLARIVQIFEE